MSRSRRWLAFVLLSLGVSAFAQESSPQTPAPAPTPRHHQAPRNWAEQRLKRLSKRLNLSDDQKEKIRPILQDEEKQMKALDEDTALTPQQKHRKMREIRMSSRSQMDSILTDEQKKLMGNNRPQGARPHHRRRNLPAQGTSTPDLSMPQ